MSFLKCAIFVHRSTDHNWNKLLLLKTKRFCCIWILSCFLLRFSTQKLTPFWSIEYFVSKIKGKFQQYRGENILNLYNRVQIVTSDAYSIKSKCTLCKILKNHINRPNGVNVFVTSLKKILSNLSSETKLIHKRSRWYVDLISSNSSGLVIGMQQRTLACLSETLIN